MSQKPVLGKGLGALLQGSPLPSQAGGAAASGENRDRQQGIAMVRPEEININPYQPRREFEPSALEELAQSIRANGIIQPLVVRKTSLGAYELIAGERRLRASKLAGLKQIPIVIRRSTDRESLEIALVENIQRQNLNCVDEALAYFQLIQDFTLTQEEVARRVGKDRASIANFLRLLKLPEAIIDDLKRQILSFGHGKALAGLEDNDLKLRARAQVVEKRLSVRDTEALVEQLKRADSATALAASGVPPTSPVEQRLRTVGQDLTRYWSAKVEVKGTAQKGKIVFHYSTRQDLDRLIEALQNQKI